MNVQRRINPLAIVPLAIGLVWLYASFQWMSWGILLLPAGVLFTSTGTAVLLWGGHNRATAFMAISVVLGVLVVPFLFFYAKAWLLLATLPVVFLCAGYLALHGHVTSHGVPVPEITPRLAFRMAVDEALVAFLVSSVPLPKPKDLPTLVSEQKMAEVMFKQKGWLENPASYHIPPPPPTNVQVRKKRIRKFDLEHVKFPSDYQPHENEPGSDRWGSYEKNKTAHGLLFRKADTPEENAKPWLICLHGYQMGKAMLDFTIFNPKHYHEKMGYNMLMPTLALHGPRTEGRISGDGFLSGNTMDTIHAAAQSISDIRQMIMWAREQGATSVGVIGYSLGGFHAALLAGLESDLDVVIPGIAAADLPMLIVHHAPPNIMAYMVHNDLEREVSENVSKVIAPLIIPLKVDKARCYLFGGTIDRITPPLLQYQLQQHWGKPAMHWFPGGHMSVESDAPLRKFIDRALMAHMK